jgi:hypothetical protein
MADEYTPQAWRLERYYPETYAKFMAALGDGIDYDDNDFARYAAEFLADLAAHDREVREPLRLQVEQLQGQLPPCDGGCDYNTGPEETCSAHGRPVAEVWEIAQQYARERDGARMALRAAQEAQT